MSVLEKIKARIARNKSVAQGPDRISEIIAEKKENMANARDLRWQQSQLLRTQIEYRLGAPLRRLVLKAQALQHNARIRRPQKSAIVHDVLVSGEGRHERMYMKLSNGQLLRADKPHRSPVLRSLIHTRLTEDAKTAGVAVSETVVPATSAN